MLEIDYGIYDKDSGLLIYSSEEVSDFSIVENKSISEAYNELLKQVENSKKLYRIKKDGSIEITVKGGFLYHSETLFQSDDFSQIQKYILQNLN